MKILQYPAYVTIDELREFSRPQSGYGYMALDIAIATAEKGMQVDLLTQLNITKGMQYKKINILKRTWLDIFVALNISHIISALKVAINDRVTINKMAKIIFYHIAMGYFEKVIRKHDYDCVHIHGVGYQTSPIIETCKKHNIRYIVTLHGLNSFSESTIVTSQEKKMERCFLREAEKSEIPVTVVSTGTKKTILEYLKNPQLKNFTVITNGCDTSLQTTSTLINIRDKHGIPNDKKVMVCVGNIGEWKNQLQIVRSFSKLPATIKEKLVILFLGNDGTNGQFIYEIKKSNYSSQLIFCGNIPRHEVSAYYGQADYNIVASISEGFGLSMIEGFVYGLPCVTFFDLDAVSDLYHEKAMCLIKERTSDALAKGITEICSRDWDKTYIRQHAQKYSMGKMAEQYINIYENLFQV